MTSPSPNTNGTMTAQAGLRPRRHNRPRSSSMYDAPGPGQSLAMFADMLPRGPRPEKSKLRLLNKSSAHLTESNKNLTNKPTLSSSTPSQLPLALTSTAHESTSQVSLRTTSTTSEVERLLAKPVLLHTTPRRRPRASTIDSVTSEHHIPQHRTGPALPLYTPGQVLVAVEGEEKEVSAPQGRSAFYQSLMAKPDGHPSAFSTPSSSLGSTISQKRRPAIPLTFLHEDSMRFVDSATASAPATATTVTTTATTTATNKKPGEIRSSPRRRLYSLVSSDGSDPSSSNLSLPHFYTNPRAARSDKTMDTMSAAIRSLAPAHTPTIEHLSPDFLQDEMYRMGKSTSTATTATTRKKEGKASRTTSAGRSPHVPMPVPTERKKPSTAGTAAGTPSPIVPSPSLSATPRQHPRITASSCRSSGAATITPKHPVSISTSPREVPIVDSRTLERRRKESSNAKVHVSGVGVSIDTATTQTHEEPGHQEQARAGAEPVNHPTKPTRPKKHRPIPPPLKLTSTTSSRKLRQSRVVSSPLFSPPLPLSPALSTVSTIAAIMMNKSKRPSEKELRRRRFMKLTRTLGEDIPPELLVNNCAGTKVKNSSVLGFQKANGKAKTKGAKRNGNVPSHRHTVAVPNRDESAVAAIAPFLSTFDVGGYDKTPGSGGGGSGVGSPNLLKKQPSLRRKNPLELHHAIVINEKVEITTTTQLDDDHDDNQHSHSPPSYSHSSSYVSPLTVQPAPYFENHPFRLTVDDDPSSPPPDHTEHNFPTSRPHVQRDSLFSLSDDIPWMRASLALPIHFESSPFMEYATAAAAAAFTGTSPDPNRLSVLDIDMSDPRGVYRREKRQGWSGEWNQPHIQDVIDKLRQL